MDVLVLATEHNPEDKEELVRLAAQQDCEIELVNESDMLMQFGGVGCLLRYRPPGSSDLESGIAGEGSTSHEEKASPSHRTRRGANGNGISNKR